MAIDEDVRVLGDRTRALEARVRVLEDVLAVAEAHDVIGVTVRDDDERELVLRLLRHVRHGGLDRADVALVRLAGRDAAVDEDVLWPVVRRHGQLTLTAGISPGSGDAAGAPRAHNRAVLRISAREGAVT